ncbi:hypothetical protein BOTNAR_0181g00060 [Botryotinia narcissicola]|uniref:Uncharacterized protein n=1 Tax=Botryotinia narcissicola TaxID=278944 RepID=A0A4Z1IH24_9HELO|nr:hypothetical protein BOTNAR_0181g00060 [Botryotinia narcissicola]
MAMSSEGNSISPYEEEAPPAYSSVDDHTLPVRTRFIKLGFDAPCEVMDQSGEDCNLQRMKNIEISTIVNQEISCFVRVYQGGHNGKHPSQKEVIDSFDAWNYAVQYYEATTLKRTISCEE